MPLYTTEAIALKGIHFGEADRIVTFYTRKYGKIKGIAKGARRIKSKLGAYIEPLTYTKLIYFGKENTNIYKINSLDLIDAFYKNRSTYGHLVASLYLLDLTNALTPEYEPHEELFDLLIFSLKSLGEVPPDKFSTQINLFRLKALTLQGYGPRLDGCVYCRKKKRAFSAFHIGRGGVVCRDCLQGAEDAFRISQGGIHFMKKVLETRDRPLLNRLSISIKLNYEVEKLLEEYLRRHLGKELKSSRFL